MPLHGGRGAASGHGGQCPAASYPAHHTTYAAFTPFPDGVADDAARYEAVFNGAVIDYSRQAADIAHTIPAEIVCYLYVLQRQVLHRSRFKKLEKAQSRGVSLNDQPRDGMSAAVEGPLIGIY